MDKQVDQKRPHLRVNGVLDDPDPLVGARVAVAVSHQRTEAGDLPWARFSFGQRKADVSRSFTAAQAMLFSVTQSDAQSAFRFARS
jgi:hypothetical protein